MDPIPQTSWVLGICIIFCIIFFDNVFSYFMKYDMDIYIHGIIAVSIGLIGAGLIHSYYLDTDRTATLYRKYKSSLPIKQIKQGTIFSFVFIFLPFLLTILWIVIEHIFFKSSS